MNAGRRTTAIGSTTTCGTSAASGRGAVSGSARDTPRPSGTIAGVVGTETSRRGRTIDGDIAEAGVAVAVQGGTATGTTATARTSGAEGIERDFLTLLLGSDALLTLPAALNGLSRPPRLLTFEVLLRCRFWISSSVRLGVRFNVGQRPRSSLNTTPTDEARHDKRPAGSPRPSCFRHARCSAAFHRRRGQRRFQSAQACASCASLAPPKR